MLLRDVGGPAPVAERRRDALGPPLGLVRALRREMGADAGHDERDQQPSLLRGRGGVECLLAVVDGDGRLARDERGLREAPQRGEDQRDLATLTADGQRVAEQGPRAAHVAAAERDEAEHVA